MVQLYLKCEQPKLDSKTLWTFECFLQCLNSETDRPYWFHRTPLKRPLRAE